MTKVITHQGQKWTVDLCKEHSKDAAIVASHLGVDYLGVKRGLHAGECRECAAHDENGSVLTGTGEAYDNLLDQMDPGGAFERMADPFGAGW